MASIRKEISVDAPVEHVWAALRDLGNVHGRLAQQFVVTLSSMAIPGWSRSQTAKSFENGSSISTIVRIAWCMP